MSTGDTVKLNDHILVLADVTNLIDKYGIERVQYALDYIANYPKAKSLTHTYGKFTLTNDQHERIVDTYAGGNQFIQAIKVFREITNCGLKEAKEAIEIKFNRPVYRY
jgi:ribosomal protein L7/L12